MSWANDSLVGGIRRLQCYKTSSTRNCYVIMVEWNLLCDSDGVILFWTEHDCWLYGFRWFLPVETTLVINSNCMKDSLWSGGY